MIYPFRVSVLDAAFEIAQYFKRTGDFDLSSAQSHLMLGPSSISGLDYSAVARVTATFGWSLFSASTDRVIFYRETLKNLILLIRPPWSKNFTRGRDAVKSALNANELQCFRDASLLSDEMDEGSRQWWDQIASTFRQLDDDFLLTVGRAGEQLSFRMENTRLSAIGLRAKWIALEDNAAGFDLLSFTSEDGTPEELMIEVKAVTFAPVSFFFTRSEWEKAQQNPGRYVVHLWVLSGQLFRSMTVGELNAHIPTDCGSGMWQQVKVRVPLSSRWMPIESQDLGPPS